MLKYLRKHKISLPRPSDRPDSVNCSDSLGLARWLPLVIIALATAFAGGCKKGEKPEFEPNLVYIKQQEEIIGQPLVEQQHEDIDARLKKLFGTSAEPTLPKHPDVQAMFPISVSNADAALFRDTSGCVRCHGYAGTGAGTEAVNHEPYPRDYRRGIFKYKATKKGARPTDGDLRRIITNGVSGARMP